MESMLKQLPLVILASAALSFGQIATAPSPQGYGYGGMGTNQPAQRQMISPGTVNYVEGNVSLDNQALNPRTSVIMRPGQTLTTGDGYGEVLLTPGAFLRVGPNSEINLTAAGLADTAFRLDRGSASVEVDQLIKGTHLNVNLGNAHVEIKKNGLYDFNADQQSVRVMDGKLRVDAANREKTIGKGDELLLASEKPLKTRDFDMKHEKLQPLYVWSEARSRDESQANVALAENLAANGGGYGPGWYWDPYWSFYAWLPGDGLLNSPFGWGFYSPAFIGYYGFPYGFRGYRGFRRPRFPERTRRCECAHRWLPWR